MSVVPSNKILISSSRLPGLAVIFPINPYIALSHLFLLLPDNGIGAKTTPAVAALAMKINSPLEILLIDNKDRKSTRLNSSHVAISYAVFCLKKKIYNENRY